MTQPTYPVTISREYPPAPLVGVAAVVFNQNGDVLLVERGRQPAKGKWGLPGGLLDLGEPTEAGVMREVMEETGAKIEIVDLVGIFQPIERDASGRIRYHFVVIDYWAHYTGGRLQPDDDAADVAWVPLQQLDTLPMEEPPRQIIRKAHKLWQQAMLER